MTRTCIAAKMLRSALIGSTLLAGHAWAEPPTEKKSRPAPKAAERSEQLIVTGTRTAGKKVYQSLSPVEVVSHATLARTGLTNLRDALTAVVPSVTANSFGTDVGGLTDSIRLRGLNPDDTLVLVDGKRLHGTANVYASTGPQQGSTPADIDMIPASMIDHIEILRDGAAAQYGSDAVAGVANIILKSSDHGGSLEGLTGIYSEGDGFTASATGDAGYKLGTDGGFIHVGLDFRHQDPTDRTGIDTRYNSHADEFFGTPENTRESIGINFEKPITPGITLYGFGTYAHRYSQAYAFTRNAPASELGNYPSGVYEPVDTGTDNSYTGTLGIKGDDLLGFHWDLSTTFGGDHFSTGMYSSLNPGLLADAGSSPTTFFLGSYDTQQWTNNLDLTRKIHLPLLAAPANLALGLEHRYESFDLVAGDSASTSDGGSSGLEGLPSSSAGNHSRDVYAAYADLDMNITPRWEVDFAGRFEHYTDVSNTENGKISTRYAITKRVAVRGTISNGFRAPTLAEEYFSNLGVSPSAASGLLAADSISAEKLGGTRLKPERSTNVSAGLVLEPVDRLHMAVDVYQINIRDRIAIGGSYSGATAIAAIESEGIGIPSTITADNVSVDYFTNAASTRTQGLDITSEYPTDFGRYGFVSWSLGVDLNRTRLTHDSVDQNGNAILNAQEVAFLTTTSPRSKIILAAFWRLQRWDATLRETRWGSTSDELQYTTGPNAYSVSTFVPFEAKPRYITDLEVGYKLTPRLHLALGANNVWNTHPTEVPPETRIFGTTIYDYYATQIGFNGGFYYLRANYNF